MIVKITLTPEARGAAVEAREDRGLPVPDHFEGPEFDCDGYDISDQGISVFLPEAHYLYPWHTVARVKFVK